MLCLVSYDVTGDGNRRRVMECLKDYGRRVQYSVFECNLGEDELKQMWRRLAPEIDPAHDSVRLYGLCKDCEQQVAILGRGDVYSESDVVII